MQKRTVFGVLAALTVAGLTTLNIGCGNKAAGSEGGTDAAPDTSISGTVMLDGSSTVSPIMEAVAEEFGAKYPEVKPTVGVSGTGGGFKKFSAGEIDIANASRPIEEDEIAACQKNGVEFIELPIAFDGLSVVVNPANDWAEDITVEELKKIWEPNSKVKTWADVRAGFPAEPIKLYGAGTDSGTFDYFTKAINGEEGASRPDYQASEDDNVLVQGVAGDKGSLGYFGYAYYEQSKDKLKLLKVAGVAPARETIADGTYQPLSRPLFVYVNKKSLEKPAVKAYLDFLLGEGTALITEVGYVPLPEEDYAAVKDRLAKGTPGTVFRGAETGIRIKDLLSREAAK